MRASARRVTPAAARGATSLPARRPLALHPGLALSPAPGGGVQPRSPLEGFCWQGEHPAGAVRPGRPRAAASSPLACPGVSGLCPWRPEPLGLPGNQICPISQKGKARRAPCPAGDGRAERSRAWPRHFWYKPSCTISSSHVHAAGPGNNSKLAASGSVVILRKRIYLDEYGFWFGVGKEYFSIFFGGAWRLGAGSEIAYQEERVGGVGVWPVSHVRVPGLAPGFCLLTQTREAAGCPCGRPVITAVWGVTSVWELSSLAVVSDKEINNLFLRECVGRKREGQPRVRRRQLFDRR